MAAAGHRASAFRSVREQHGKEWRRLPQIAIGILFAYIGVNLLITDARRCRGSLVQPTSDRRFSHRRRRWSSGGATSCGAKTIATAAAHTIRPRGGFGRVGACEPSNMADPLVHAAIRSDRRLQKFLEWSILPQADVDPGPLRCASDHRRRTLRRGAPLAAGARDRHPDARRRLLTSDPRQAASEFITAPA